MLRTKSKQSNENTSLEDFEDSFRYWFDQRKFDKQFNIFLPFVDDNTEFSVEAFTTPLASGNLAAVKKQTKRSVLNFGRNKLKEAGARGYLEQGKVRKLTDKVTKSFDSFTVSELLSIEKSLSNAQEKSKNKASKEFQKRQILRAYVLRLLAIRSEESKQALGYFKTIIAEKLIDDLMCFPNPFEQHANYPAIADALLEDSLKEMLDPQKQSLYFYINFRLSYYCPLLKKNSKEEIVSFSPDNFDLYVRLYNNNLLKKEHDTMQEFKKQIEEYCVERIKFLDETLATAQKYKETFAELQEIEKSGFSEAKDNNTIKLMQALCYLHTAQTVDLAVFLNYFKEVDFFDCKIDPSTDAVGRRSDAVFTASKLGYTPAVLLQLVGAMHTVDGAAAKFQEQCTKFVCDLALILLGSAKEHSASVPVEVSGEASFSDQSSKLIDQYFKPLEEIKTALQNCAGVHQASFSAFAKSLEADLKKIRGQHQDYCQAWLKHYSQDKRVVLSEEEIATIIQNLSGDDLYQYAKSRIELAKAVIFSEKFNLLSDKQKGMVVTSWSLNDRSLALRCLDTDFCLEVLDDQQKKDVCDYVIKQAEEDDAFAKSVVKKEFILARLNEKQKQKLLAVAVALSKKDYDVGKFLFSSALYRQYLSVDQQYDVRENIVGTAEGLGFVEEVIKQGALDEYQLALVLQAIRSQIAWQVKVIPSILKFPDSVARSCITEMLLSNEMLAGQFFEDEPSLQKIISGLRSKFLEKQQVALCVQVAKIHQPVAVSLFNSRFIEQLSYENLKEIVGSFEQGDVAVKFVQYSIDQKKVLSTFESYLEKLPAAERGQVAFNILANDFYSQSLSDPQRESFSKSLVAQMKGDSEFNKKVIMTDTVLPQLNEQQRETFLSRAIDVSTKNREVAKYLFNSALYRQYLNVKQQNLVREKLIGENGEGLGFVENVIDQAVVAKRELLEHELVLVLQAIRSQRTWQSKIIPNILKLSESSARDCITAILLSNESMALHFFSDNDTAHLLQHVPAMRSNFSEEQFKSLYVKVAKTHRAVALEVFDNSFGENITYQDLKEIVDVHQSDDDLVVKFVQHSIAQKKELSVFESYLEKLPEAERGKIAITVLANNFYRQSLSDEQLNGFFDSLANQMKGNDFFSDHPSEFVTELRTKLSIAEKRALCIYLAKQNTIFATSLFENKFLNHLSYDVVKEIVDCRLPLSKFAEACKLSESFVQYHLSQDKTLNDCKSYLKGCFLQYLNELAKKKMSYAELLFGDVELMSMLHGTVSGIVQHYEETSVLDASILRFNWFLTFKKDKKERKAKSAKQRKSSVEAGPVELDSLQMPTQVNDSREIPYIDGKVFKALNQDQLYSIALRDFKYFQVIVSNPLLLETLGVSSAKQLLDNYQGAVLGDKSEYDEVSLLVLAYEKKLRTMGYYEQLEKTVNRINIKLKARHKAVQDFNEALKEYNQRYSFCQGWEDNYRDNFLTWVETFSPKAGFQPLVFEKIDVDSFVGRHSVIENTGSLVIHKMLAMSEQASVDGLANANKNMLAFAQTHQNILKNNEAGEIETFTKKIESENLILANNLRAYKQMVEKDIAASKEYVESKEAKQKELAEKIKSAKVELERMANKLLRYKGLSVGGQSFQIDTVQPITQTILEQNTAWNDEISGKLKYIKIGPLKAFRIRYNLCQTGTLQKIVLNNLKYRQKEILQKSHERFLNQGSVSVSDIASWVEEEQQSLYQVCQNEAEVLEKKGLSGQYNNLIKQKNAAIEEFLWSASKKIEYLKNAMGKIAILQSHTNLFYAKVVDVEQDQASFALLNKEIQVHQKQSAVFKKLRDETNQSEVDPGLQNSYDEAVNSEDKKVILAKNLVLAAGMSRMLSEMPLKIEGVKENEQSAISFEQMRQVMQLQYLTMVGVNDEVKKLFVPQYSGPVAIC